MNVSVGAVWVLLIVFCLSSILIIFKFFMPKSDGLTLIRSEWECSAYQSEIELLASVKQMMILPSKSCTQYTKKVK